MSWLFPLDAFTSKLQLRPSRRVNIFVFFILACCLPLKISAQSSNKHFLRVTPFEGTRDSTSLEIEAFFWSELREQLEKSESVSIVSGWDQITKLLEVTEDVHRVSILFDTTSIQTPNLKAPTVFLSGSIQRLNGLNFRVDVQVLEIETGEQLASEVVDLTLSGTPFLDEISPVMRRVVFQLMEHLDPQVHELKSWIGEPFDPDKINILIADFIDHNGKVDDIGKQYAFKVYNELDTFIKSDPELKKVVEIKRLYSEGNWCSSQARRSGKCHW